MIYENNENNFEKSLNELLILFTGTGNEHQAQLSKSQMDDLGWQHEDEDEDDNSFDEEESKDKFNMINHDKIDFNPES